MHPLFENHRREFRLGEALPSWMILDVGIDYYTHGSGLFGCVNDAHAVKAVMDRNSDGSVNFATRLLTGTSSSQPVLRSDLRRAIQELFSGENETALFYFAGHGHIETAGGFLVASDSSSGDDGISLNDVVTWANASSTRNKIIILDSCHSGVAGSTNGARQSAELNEGLTILTASTAEQYASEENGGGVFTGLLVDALSGAAANLLGEVTPGSVYAHIDQSLGPWEQRPVFKTNVKSFVSLRKTQPPVSEAEIRRIVEFFPAPGYEFALDATYEPEGPNPNPVNTEKFALLQKFNRVNLVVPLNAPHMYHAAMGSTGCKLTVLGEHYRRLVVKNRI